MEKVQTLYIFTAASEGTCGLQESPGEGNGNPLQHSHPGNAMGRGPWWASVHGVTESRTQLSG